jgi:hypothetical protein
MPYAFNDSVLNSDELYQIKKEADGNRAAYGMAPIGPDIFFRYINTETFDSLPIEKQAVFLFNLTIKYSLPLKAVLYRLREEGIFSRIDDLMRYYPVLKEALLSVFCDSVYVKELYSNKNRYISEPLYQLLPVLYENGRIGL